METKIENSAAGSVTDVHAVPLVVCWLVIMVWIKAAFFGRFTHLLFGSIRANM